MAAQVAEDRAGTVTPPPVTAAEAATLGVPDLFTRLGNGPDGLGEDEAARRLRVLGPNAVRSYRARAWPVLRGQLRSPLLLLLAVTAVVSWAAGAIAWLRWHWDSDDSRRQLPPDVVARTERHAGYWVVLRDGRVVATGRDSKASRRELSAGGREYWVAPPGTSRPRIPRGVGTWPPG